MPCLISRQLEFLVERSRLRSFDLTSTCVAKTLQRVVVAFPFVLTIIMLQIDSFTAWITVEGVELKEYNIDVSDDGKCTTCWIPSELGKASLRSNLLFHSDNVPLYQNFSVNWKDSRRLCITSGRIWVDGNRCDGAIICPELKHDTQCSNGIQVSEQTYRPYLFSKINLTGKHIWFLVWHNYNFDL